MHFFQASRIEFESSKRSPRALMMQSQPVQPSAVPIKKKAKPLTLLSVGSQKCSSALRKSLSKKSKPTLQLTNGEYSFSLLKR